MKPAILPPIHTAIADWLGWTLDRTADLPKSARFTFAQRQDNLTLDALMLVKRAIYSPRPQKTALLRELNPLPNNCASSGTWSGNAAGSASSNCASPMAA